MSDLKRLGFPRPRVVAPEPVAVPLIDEEFDISDIDEDEDEEDGEDIAALYDKNPDSFRIVEGPPPPLPRPVPVKKLVASEPAPVETPPSGDIPPEVAEAMADEKAVAATLAEDSNSVDDEIAPECLDEDPDDARILEKPLLPPARPVPTVRDTSRKPTPPMNQGLMSARVGGKLPFPR